MEPKTFNAKSLQIRLRYHGIKMNLRTLRAWLNHFAKFYNLKEVQTVFTEKDVDTFELDHYITVLLGEEKLKDFRFKEGCVSIFVMCEAVEITENIKYVFQKRLMDLVRLPNDEICKLP